MTEDNSKDGVTVKQIEEFAKKYRYSILLCISFILAFFFSFVFFGPGWGILFASIGGVLGAIFPKIVEQLITKSYHFLFKQEMVTQIVLAVVIIVISIFLPLVIYLVMGGVGGSALYQLATSPRAEK